MTPKEKAARNREVIKCLLVLLFWNPSKWRRFIMTCNWVNIALCFSPWNGDPWRTFYNCAVIALSWGDFMYWRRKYIRRKRAREEHNKQIDHWLEEMKKTGQEYREAERRYASTSQLEAIEHRFNEAKRRVEREIESYAQKK